MLTYFDSSVLLSIILDEKRSDEARKLWSGASVGVSSILLKIEVLTVLRRTYSNNEIKLGKNWLLHKIKLMDELLQEIYFRVLDDDIDKIIYLKKELRKYRTLDAIHIATAWNIKTIVESEDFTIVSFDREMLNSAKILKFKVNEINEENFI